MIPRYFLLRIRLTAVFLLALAIASLPCAAHAQQVRSDEEIGRILTIEKLNIQDGNVAGELRNKAKHTVRDVQLFVRYLWLWADEYKPGKSDPGTSAYYTLRDTIQPGEKINFTYKPSPPLPQIAGGKFVTSVQIAGFAEIMPQK